MKKDTVGLRITLDGTQLKREVAQSRREFKTLSDEVVAESARMDTAFKGIGNTLKGLGAAWSLKEMGSAIVKVRGEFQQLEVAMETMLGSKTKAQMLMAQMVQTAATTPFGLQEVAGGAKQLLAYGLEAEKVNDTLIRLGDIASGLSIPLGDMVYLFGTTMAQGRLYTQDLNQFTGRGIPMIAELAKIFGVAKSEVKGLVEEGKVGFPEVQKVIENLTKEGGKFGGLMEKQSKTITGQISNIEDSFDMMFNEIGQQNEGVINSALDGVGWLIEHYEEVGDVLMTLVATYGVYKATLIATTAYTNAAYSYEATQLRAMLADKTASIDADLAGAVAKGRMTAARAQEVQALRAELNAKIANAQASAVEAQAEASAATRKRMLAQIELNKARIAVEAKQEEIFAMESIAAAQTAETLRTEQNALVKQMHAAQERLDAAAKAENGAKTKAATAAQAVNTLQTQRDTIAKKLNATQTRMLTVLTNGLKKALNSLKAAWASNPVGMILMGVTMVAGALMTLSDASESASIESNKFGEAAAKTVSEVDMLFAVINATNNKSKVHKDAIAELSKIYEEAGIHIDNEKDKLEQLNNERERAIELIKQEGAERDKANNIASYNEAIKASTDKMKANLLEQLQSAEWDGSGYIDDWDANEVQDHAEELKVIIGGIYESYADDLAKITDPKELEAKKKEVKNKIIEAYRDVLGIDSDEVAAMSMASLDVDFDGIFDDYIESSGNLLNARDRLVASYEKGKESAEKEAKAIDYTTMSFSDLFDETQKVEGKLNDIGNIKVEPTIVTESIERAKAILERFEKMFGVVGFSAEKFLSGIETSKESTGANDAETEMERRMTEALKTRKGIADMLKNVNEKLDSAVVGSTEEKDLLARQKRLQDAQKKLKSNSDKINKEADKRKKAEENATKKLLKIQEENANNEVALMTEGHKKKMAQIAQDFEKEKAEIAEQAKELAKLNNEAGIAGVNNNGLTEEQQKATDEALRLAKEKRVKAEGEVLKAEATAMRDYLKEYGSLQQQKLAIAEDYAQRIAEATTEGEKLRLQKERDRALSNFALESITMGIDWHALLSGVGSLSVEMMRPMLEQLEAYTQTDDYATADIQEREKVTELMQELRRFVGTDNQVTWETLAQATRDFEASVARYQDLTAQERVALDALSKAEEQLKKGEITPEDYAKIKASADKLSAETVTASNDMQALGKTLNNVTEEVKNYVSPLTTALNKLGTWSNLDGFSSVKSSVEQIDALKGALDSALPSMGDGIGKDIGTTLSSTIGKGLGAIGGDVTSLLSTGIGSIVGIIAQIPKLILDIVDSIKGMVTGAIDSMTELISLRWIDELINGILGSISGLIDAIFDLPENLYHVVESIIVEGVGGLLNTILGRVGNILSFGLLGSDGPAEWFSGSNAKDVQYTINRLTERNELLTTAIESLTEEMERSRGAKSVQAYRDAVKMQEETNQNYLDMAKAQAGYVGHHHSWSYYWEGFTDEEIARVSQQIGRAWDGSLWSLSPEEMELLRANVDIWERIQNNGEGDYGERLTDQLDNYIDQAGKLEELKEALYEGLTGISFDSMYDSFIDNLMDMEYSAKDAADDISEYFTKAMLSNKIGEMMSGQLEDWYNRFGTAMEDGSLSDSEREALLAEYMGYVEEAEKWRDEIFAATGYGGSSASQDSTKKGFATASQDSIDELNGRFTGIQMAVEAIKGQNGIMIDIARSQRLDIASMRQYTEEIRGLSLSAINHLADISRNTYQLYEINSRLEKIEKNTRYS